MPSSLEFPAADRKELLRQYELRTEVSQFLPDSFLSNIAWRIYTEYCCGEGVANDHRNFKLTPHWENFINQQVHLALERRSNCNVFIDEDSEKHGIYLQARTAIMAAVVSRAIMLFNAWEGTWPKQNEPADTRNLRADLAPHIKDPQFA